VNWFSSLVAFFTKPFQPPPLDPSALAAQADAATASAAPPPESARRLRPGCRTALIVAVHVIVVTVVVVLLWFLERAFGLDQVLRSRWPVLYRAWLPLLFLLFYALFLLGWWLWRLLGPERVEGIFPDIESAWAAAVAELRAGGIDVTEVPLFLVLGRPSGSLEQFFAASRQPFQVRHSPSLPDSPLHVYANREGVFVTCEGACLLARQADRLAELAPSQGSTGDPVPVLGEARSASSPGGEAALSGAEETAPASVLLLGEDAPAVRQRLRRPPLLRDEAGVALSAARLRHLCRLIARDRQPYCPVNGILVLVPLAATDSPQDAGETGAVCRQDFGVARAALQTDCPRFVVLCGGERMPGFRDVVDHFPEGQNRHWVLGQHFPLVPDMTREELPAMVAGGLGWVGDTLLPVVAARLMDPDDLGANVRLFRLLREGRERLRLLGRVAAHGVLGVETGPPLLGGCYVAGTGADAAGEQAFLAGVFRRLVEHQNFVTWTDDAVREDTEYHWWTRVGYLGLAAFVVVVVALVVAWWW
jgi:hypothetical protein